MNDVITYVQEQVKYLPVAQSIAKYNRKSANLQNKLGRLWEILDPLVDLALNYIIFGVLMHRVVPGYPAVAWMFIGMGSYNFSQNIVIQGSKSVASNYKLSSTMKFPVSIMPLSSAFGYFTEFYLMMGAGFLLAIVNGYMPALQYLQVIYYFICMMAFALSLSLLNSSIIVIFPDFKYLLKYIFRILMYVSGSVISLTQFKIIPPALLRAQILNPFYFINEGFRDAAFHGEWFWQKGMYNFSFWAITILILLLATNLHMKIRDKIADYL